MMTSATKSEEKRRDWSVQRGVDHNKIRVNQAVETRNRAQFLGQVPKQQRKSYRRLARGTKHRQHARKGILLGECRLKRLPNNILNIAMWFINGRFSSNTTGMPNSAYSFGCLFSNARNNLETKKSQTSADRKSTSKRTKFSSST